MPSPASRQLGLDRTRGGARWLLALVALLVAIPAVGQDGPPAPPSPRRIDALNAAFLEHLQTLEPAHAMAVASIRRGWEETYRQNAPQGFVPDALALLYPHYRAALDAFDAGDAHEVERLLKDADASSDPYLRANALYLRTRALLDRGMLEEAQGLLQTVADNAEAISTHTPYAPNLWLMKSHCEARDLDFAAAAGTVADLRARFPAAPEAIDVGARQLSLELERHQPGTLDEVSDLMQYAATRLAVTDASGKVRTRQDDAVALLDKLIEEAQQREQQQQQQSGGGVPQGDQAQGSPRRGLEESIAPEGAGRIGELHGAPKANPGESWGKLPPSEREEILKSLRSRFPSRYRQLVEQYYRSLAEEER